MKSNNISANKTMAEETPRSSSVYQHIVMEEEGGTVYWLPDNKTEDELSAFTPSAIAKIQRFCCQEEV